MPSQGCDPRSHIPSHNVLKLSFASSGKARYTAADAIRSTTNSPAIVITAAPRERLKTQRVSTREIASPKKLNAMKVITIQPLARNVLRKRSEEHTSELQ